VHEDAVGIAGDTGEGGGEGIGISFVGGRGDGDVNSDGVGGSGEGEGAFEGEAVGSGSGADFPEVGGTGLEGSVAGNIKSADTGTGERMAALPRRRLPRTVPLPARVRPAEMASSAPGSWETSQTEKASMRRS